MTLRKPEEEEFIVDNKKLSDEDMEEMYRRADEAYGRLEPILRGQDPRVIGLVLGRAAARWISGHRASEGHSTKELHGAMLRAHCAGVEGILEKFRELTEPRRTH